MTREMFVGSLGVMALSPWLSTREKQVKRGVGHGRAACERRGMGRGQCECVRRIGEAVEAGDEGGCPGREALNGRREAKGEERTIEAASKGVRKGLKRTKGC